MLRRPVRASVRCRLLILIHGTIIWYYLVVKRKHQRTLERIYFRPTLANIAWREIEGLLVTMGAEVSEGSGSRVKIFLNNEVAIFHRPHPQKEASKATVRDVRNILENAGVKP